MAEKTITDGTSNSIPIEEEVGQDADAPTGDTTSGSGVPTGRGEPPPADTAPLDSEIEIVPEPDAPTGDSTPPNPNEPVKSDPAADVPPDDFTESGASPEPDGEFNELPAAPDVIDPDADGVVVSPASLEDGEGTNFAFLDRDGDGLFETRVEVVQLEDGSFKRVTEPEVLDEPLTPEQVGVGVQPVDGAAPPEDAPVPLEDDAAPPDLPGPGEFIDPNEVDVVETRPGFFEADLDGDGTNDVEFRGRVGEDGLIEVERARPIDGERPAEINEDNADEAGNTGTPEITPDNADEASTDEPINEFEDQKPEVPRDPDGDAPSEVVVVETPDEPPTGDEPPPTPKEEAVGDGSPPGIGEIEDIPPDQEPSPVDRLRPDRESPPPEDEADPPGEAVADVPPLPPDEAPVEPPAGEVAPPAEHEPPVAEHPPAAAPPAHEPPAAGHEPPTETEVDLPGLYDAPPPYASGSDGHAPPAGGVAPDDPGYEPAGEAVPGVPVPADDYEPETDDPADEPIEVKAEEDGDDAGLLEQVADAVGDLWDDAKDAVT